MTCGGKVAIEELKVYVAGIPWPRANRFAASRITPSTLQEEGMTIHRIHPAGISSEVCSLIHDSESSSPPPAPSSKPTMGVYPGGSKASSSRRSKAGGDVQEFSVSATSQSARSAHYPTNPVAVSQSGPSVSNGDRPAILTSTKGHPTESKVASSSPNTLNVARLAGPRASLRLRFKTKNHECANRSLRRRIACSDYLISRFGKASRTRKLVRLQDCKIADIGSPRVIPRITDS